MSPCLGAVKSEGARVIRENGDTVRKGGSWRFVIAWNHGKGVGLDMYFVGRRFLDFKQMKV